jgi:hypothetical protein
VQRTKARVPAAAASTRPRWWLFGSAAPFLRLVGDDEGHLARDADGNDPERLDAYDEANGHVVSTNPADADDSDEPERTTNRAGARLLGHGRGGFRTCDLSRVKRDEGEGEESPEQGRLF